VHLSGTAFANDPQQQIGEAPTRLQMIDERLRFELREHIDSADAGIDKVGKDKIDNAVFATEWNSRLGTVIGQWEKPFSSSTCQDDAENIIVVSLFFHFFCCLRARRLSRSVATPLAAEMTVEQVLN
jgi:hypothetical protein